MNVSLAIPREGKRALPYRADIDGIRAVAILAVVVYHAAPRALPGGFTGVDVFFVISGYLVTGILVAGDVPIAGKLREFYRGRIRRLAPALVVVLVTCLVAAWFLCVGTELAYVGKSVFASAVFLANVQLWRETDYFDTHRARLLLHLWSLGVEGQFYLAWPLLLAAVGRWTPRRRRAVGCLMVLSFGLGLALLRVDKDTAFSLPFGRLWQFLAGALLALPAGSDCPVGTARSVPVAWLLALAGVALLGVSFTRISGARDYPGWWAILPTAGAACLLSAGSSAPAGGACWGTRRSPTSVGSVTRSTSGTGPCSSPRDGSVSTGPSSKRRRCRSRCPSQRPR
jgi:peptidoglycan/LPS O-acetylase OafA/YrhL